MPFCMFFYEEKGRFLKGWVKIGRKIRKKSEEIRRNQEEIRRKSGGKIGWVLWSGDRKPNPVFLNVYTLCAGA